MTLKCGDKTWNLHKNILCSRSEWFEKALTGKFQEAQTGLVEIQNFGPEAVGWVVRYIYSGSTFALIIHVASRRKSRHVMTLG